MLGSDVDRDLRSRSRLADTVQAGIPIAGQEGNLVTTETDLTWRTCPVCGYLVPAQQSTCKKCASLAAPPPIPPPTGPSSIGPQPVPIPAVVPVMPQEQPPLQPTTQREYFVQLGAFGNFANAQAFQQHMGTELSILPRVQQVNSLYRVRLGPYPTLEAATEARDRAQSVLSITLSITSSPDR